MSRSASGLVTLLILFAAVGAVGTASEPPPVEGELSVSEKAASIAGEFTHQDSTVAFDVERSSAGRVTVEVKTNGQPFYLTYDPAAATIKLRGPNGRISPEGREAVAALSEILEKRWEPYTSPISLEQHLAFRAILLLSEAPIGLELEERTLEVPGFPPNVTNPR